MEYDDHYESDWDDPDCWAQVIEENDRANLQWLAEQPYAMFVVAMEGAYARVTGETIRLGN